jgi:hypothetical protein
MSEGENERVTEEDKPKHIKCECECGCRAVASVRACVRAIQIAVKRVEDEEENDSEAVGYCVKLGKTGFLVVETWLLRWNFPLWKLGSG